jgi:arsenical pump membrane protein
MRAKRLACDDSRLMTAPLLTWIIAALATLGVIARPFRWPEAVWAVAGAVVLVAAGLLPWREAWVAIGKGADVYLFLVGMMLLSEVGRREGLFDWVAGLAVNHAQGSSLRLFTLVYLVGTVVTIFLSNDAAAVVLTPAVIVVARRAGCRPLPLLFACAFIANAASFVLPISNPANIVLYGDHTPALGPWLARFGVPSLLSILATYAALRWSQRSALAGPCAPSVPVEPLSRSGVIALASIGVTAVALLTVSALDGQLGLPTAVLGALSMLAVTLVTRRSPWPMLRGMSWNVLPLVAGLFVLVAALQHTGVIGAIAASLARAAARSETLAAGVAGVILGVGSNLVNNLPAGLVASSALQQAQVSPRVVDALLIGVDVGPNLSITGSLATILWLTAIRREGEEVGFLAFLKVGVRVMPPALLLALAARLAMG